MFSRKISKDAKYGRKCKDCDHYKTDHLWILKEQSMFWASILSPTRIMTPKQSRGQCKKCNCEKHR